MAANLGDAALRFGAAGEDDSLEDPKLSRLVSPAIECDKGERSRFRYDVVTFNQMSEQSNQKLSLSAKIPSGFFNSIFGYKGCWREHAHSTKNLAFFGCFVTLYNIALAKAQIASSEKVKQEVSSHGILLHLLSLSINMVVISLLG